MARDGTELSPSQRLAWLRLIRTDNVGPQTFRQLLNREGSAEAALAALPALLQRAGTRARIPSVAEAEDEIAALTRLGGRLVGSGEPGYPPLLRYISGAPPLVSLIGGHGLDWQHTVAIVGARNASAAGQKFARMLASDLGDARYTVVSGLARGIDAAAHKASLGTGTVAVLAGGMDRIYPEENIPLARDIVDHGGALLTEMPLGWEPRARDFPRRNRLVSGLSLGTVVVEAAARSGSLITARLALEQNREVFAVPGSPLDPRAEGGNHLIREGAVLCAEASHIVEVLAPMVRQPDLVPQAGYEAREGGADSAEPLWDELDLPGIDAAPRIAPAASRGEAVPAEGEDRTRLLSLIGVAPVALDDLVRASGVPVREVSRLVMELELDGLVERHAGGGLTRRA